MTPVDTAELREISEYQQRRYANRGVFDPQAGYKVLHRLPALLDELDALRAENERLRAALTNLSHILLDPEGNASFNGSEGDHQIAVNAFAALEGSKP